MKKKMPVLILALPLMLMMGGCAPGISISFDPAEIVLDLDDLEGRLPQEVDVAVNFLGMGILELNRVDMEMTLKDPEGILETEDNLALMEEILEDLFLYLEEASPPQEVNGTYYFRRELNITIPVFPLTQVVDEAGYLPPAFLLQASNLEELAGLISPGEEIELKIEAQIIGPDASSLSSGRFWITIIHDD